VALAGERIHHLELSILDIDETINWIARLDDDLARRVMHNLARRP
jgi:hypothetical protein